MPAWSGLFNGEHGEDHALLVNKNSLSQRLSKLMRRGGNRKTKELLLTVLGTAPGLTASSTYTRKQAEEGQQEAVATQETVTVIGRATTSADVTALRADLEREFVPSTYPTDVSGNGGGGKLGQA